MKREFAVMAEMSKVLFSSRLLKMHPTPNELENFFTKRTKIMFDKLLKDDRYYSRIVVSWPT